VCVIGKPPKNYKWTNEKLMMPSANDNEKFNSEYIRLVFGMLQYVDKKTGASVCIVALNEQSHVLPWYGFFLGMAQVG